MVQVVHKGLQLNIKMVTPVLLHVKHVSIQVCDKGWALASTTTRQRTTTEAKSWGKHNDVSAGVWVDLGWVH